MKSQFGYSAESIQRKQLCSCGKVSFDKKGAQTKRNQLMRMGNERELRIYACPISGGKFWHLTKLV